MISQTKTTVPRALLSIVRKSSSDLGELLLGRASPQVSNQLTLTEVDAIVCTRSRDQLNTLQ